MVGGKSSLLVLALGVPVCAPGAVPVAKERIATFASSSLYIEDKADPKRYAPEKVFDGDVKTCWVENTEGDGIGERVEVTLELKDGMEGQYQYTDVVLECTGVRLSIGSVYQGTVYRTTCLAEVGFLPPAGAATTDSSKVYRIGDTGPAGGIVFYDKGSISDGWRYLYAAPMDSSGFIQWRNGKAIAIKTGRAVGPGKANTTAIVSAQGTGSYAAKQCQDLTHGVFGAVWCWSSSQHNEGDGDSAWYQDFDNGNRKNATLTDNGCSVRAVRGS
jgi:hypothetical protein